MKCEEFMSLLPQYPDAFDTETVKEAFLSHTATCASCAQRLSEHKTLLAALSTLDDDIEVPEAFSAGWRETVSQEAKAPAKPMRRTRGTLRGIAALVAAIAVMVTGTALMRGGVLFPSMRKQDEIMRSAVMDEPFSAAPAPAAFSFEEAADAYEMEEAAGAYQPAPVTLHSAIIRLNTPQYDADIAKIEALLERTGGWSENWLVTGKDETGASRTARMTLRIPMHTLDSFVGDVSAIGQLAECEMSIDDISERYYDVQGRLAMYEAQRDRLTAMLENAETLSDILDIESKLDSVQYTMEALVSQMNNWNSLSGNAVVQISIQEVSKGASGAAASVTAVARDATDRSLKEARAFLLDMLVFLIMAAPYAAILLAISLLAFCAGRALKKKRAEEEQEES